MAHIFSDFASNQPALTRPLEPKPDKNSEEARAALEKLNTAKVADRAQKCRATFGAWKQPVDGLKFQQECRQEWG